MYTIRKYGDSNIWNVQADENPVLPADLELMVRSSNFISALLHARNGKEYTFDAVGSFSIANGSTDFSGVSGVMTRSTIYQNGELMQTESWSTGYNLADAETYDYQKELSYLVGNDLFEGSSTFNNDDEVQGMEGNDTFIGYGDGQYGDRFFGGDGIDTAVFRGKISEYIGGFVDTIWDSRLDDGTLVSGGQITDTVANRDGTDWVVNVERLKFSDAMFALDTDRNAGQAYRLYKAAFDRTPDSGGLGYWIHRIDTGTSLDAAAQEFINSQEFVDLYGTNSSNAQFVTLLYEHVMHRPAEGEGFNFWVNALTAQGGWTRASVLAFFSESAENLGQTAELVANGIQYNEFIAS